MDMATGLMMVAAALYSEIESPLGYVALMGNGENSDREDYVQSVAAAFRALEQDEEERHGGQRDEIYLALRKGVAMSSRTEEGR